MYKGHMLHRMHTQPEEENLLLRLVRDEVGAYGFKPLHVCKRSDLGSN